MAPREKTRKATHVAGVLTVSVPPLVPGVDPLLELLVCLEAGFFCEVLLMDSSFRVGGFGGLLTDGQKRGFGFESFVGPEMEVVVNADILRDSLNEHELFDRVDGLAVTVVEDRGIDFPSQGFGMFGDALHMVRPDSDLPQDRRPRTAKNSRDFAFVRVVMRTDEHEPKIKLQRCFAGLLACFCGNRSWLPY